MNDMDLAQARREVTGNVAGRVGAWLQAMRPRTLPAVIGPVLLGQVLVDSGFFTWSTAVLCLVCGLALQIAVNLANDLFDGLSGVDQDDRLGPVRAMHSGLLSGRALAVGLSIALAVAALTGLWLIIHGHWLLWLFGAGALLAVLGYSGGARPYANLGLGEMVVWVFFGPVAVLGSLLAHGSPITTEAVWAGVLVGLPVAAIMVVNNLRDRFTDIRAGKMTLPARLGRKRTLWLFAGLTLLPVLVSVPVGSGAWSWLAWGVVMTTALLLNWRLQQSEGRALNPVLGMTAGYALLFAIWLMTHAVI
jgi:1,4-dihydroxy-2-naphthoate polyprenyltransferase